MNKGISFLSNCCQENPLTKKIVIVPSYQTGHQIGEALAKESGAWINLHFVTLPSLAQETAGIELSTQGITLVSQANSLFLVDRVFRRLKAAKKLKYFGQVEATTGIVRALRHSIFALRMAGWRSCGRWNISKQNSWSYCPRRMRKGSRTNEVERLKRHLEKGRLKLVAREIYAGVRFV